MSEHVKARVPGAGALILDHVHWMGTHPEVGGLRKVGATMWQLFLERFVPLVDDDVSALDRLDGVGASASRRTPTRDVATKAASPGGDSSLVPRP